jgi:hypothetical protein
MSLSRAPKDLTCGVELVEFQEREVQELAGDIAFLPAAALDGMGCA